MQVPTLSTPTVASDEAYDDVPAQPAARRSRASAAWSAAWPRLLAVAHAIQQIAADGQLDECDLTLRDLGAIERSFAATLLALSAARPEPPSDERPPLRVLAPEPQAKLAGK